MDVKTRAIGTAIFFLSLGFLLFGIQNHPAPIFDESMYVNGARALLTGVGDANLQHPPLAKFFIAGGIKVAGDNPLGWRLAGSIFGSATLVAIFFWTLLLLQDMRIALISTALTLLNNFLFVMARVTMLDVFYFAFVMWGVLAFTAATRMGLTVKRRRCLMVFSGILFGLGMACKWNALVSLAAIALASVVLYARDRQNIRSIGIPTLSLAWIIVPAVVYCLSFWPLCQRLHRPFTLAELAAMNRFIWQYHVNCPGNPWLDTRWYSWIFRRTPEPALSYLMGNFVVVWGGFVALLICGWRFLRNPAFAEGLVLLLYLVNLLQWVAIPQQRTVYYYYYPCAMFLGISLAIVLKNIMTVRIFQLRPAILVMVAAAVFFLYCYPRMTYLDPPYDCALGCWD